MDFTQQKEMCLSSKAELHRVQMRHVPYVPRLLVDVLINVSKQKCRSPLGNIFATLPCHQTAASDESPSPKAPDSFD